MVWVLKQLQMSFLKTDKGQAHHLSRKLARACGVPGVVVRAASFVNCWQRRSGHYFYQSFFLSFFPPFFPSVATFSFLLESKNLFSESCLERPKNLEVDPVAYFWPPLAAILDFAGGAALQAVSECPLCR